LSRRYENGPVVIGLANEGGGTRKTTNACNLGVALAHMGKRVGVLDGDQTMAASRYLGYGVVNTKQYPERAEAVYSKLANWPSVYQVLLGEVSVKEALYPARTRIDNDQDEIGDDDDSFEVIPNLHLILGSREMAQASDDIRSISRGKAQANTTWLRRVANDLAGTLDVLLVDFRGTFDTLEKTEIAACDYIIGCVKPDQKDDDTLDLLQAVIDDTRMEYEFSGGAADLRYVLINGAVTNRGRFYTDMVDSLRDYYGDMVLPTISETVGVAESVNAQEPVRYWLGPDSQTAKEFDAVAQALDLVW
jgi:cellulose biosynthesis protein BcsQ